MHIADVNYDGLITGLVPTPFVGAGTIRKGEAEVTYKKGTVFAKSSADDKLVILGTEAEVANAEFDGDGATTDFKLDAAPDKVLAVKVSDTEVAYTYDASTGIVKCASAPAAGTKNVVVEYAGEELTPYGVLCEDTTVGTDDDENAAVYLAGCFDPNKFEVAEGYDLTEADKDALRIRNIYLAEAID